MKMQFQVTYPDQEPIVVTAGPKEIIAFEREYDKSVMKLTEDMRYESFAYLAWAVLHFRMAREPDGFDEFLSKIDDVDPYTPPEVDEGEKPAAADDPSSLEVSATTSVS